MSIDPQRFRQSFSNFLKACEVFDRRLEDYLQHTGMEAQQMALVQAYEIFVELAWKTMKHYLELHGYTDIKNSRHAVRYALQDGIIENGDLWMSAIEVRNMTSHVYQPEILLQTLNFINGEFSAAAKSLKEKLATQAESF